MYNFLAEVQKIIHKLDGIRHLERAVPQLGQNAAPSGRPAPQLQQNLAGTPGACAVSAGYT